MDRQDRNRPEVQGSSEGQMAGAVRESPAVVRRDYLEALLIRRRHLKGIGASARDGVPGLSSTNFVVAALAPAPNAGGVVTRDAHRCAGCRRCEVVCSIVNTGFIDPALSYVRADRQSNGTLFPQACLDCGDPVPCLSACPLAGLESDRLIGANARLAIERACAGCRKCEEACSRSVLAFAEAPIKEMSCDLCSGDPHCVKECPLGALTYVSAVGRMDRRARRE